MVSSIGTVCVAASFQRRFATRREIFNVDQIDAQNISV